MSRQCDALFSFSFAWEHPSIRDRFSPSHLPWSLSCELGPSHLIYIYIYPSLFFSIKILTEGINQMNISLRRLPIAWTSFFLKWTAILTAICSSVHLLYLKIVIVRGTCLLGIFLGFVKKKSSIQRTKMTEYKVIFPKLTTTTQKNCVFNFLLHSTLWIEGQMNNVCSLTVCLLNMHALSFFFIFNFSALFFVSSVSWHYLCNNAVR